MASLPTYLCPTEDPTRLKSILQGYHLNPRTILSVVGGLPWPVFFADLYPLAKVFSFDNNPAQINLFGDEISGRTRNTPQLVDVRDFEKFRCILSQTMPSLLYLSNIPNYLLRAEPMGLAKILYSEGIRWILLSAITQSERRTGSNPSGTASFLRELSKNGYSYDSYHKAKSDAFIKTFHFAWQDFNP